MLICSYTFTRKFSLSSARIRVTDCDIKFLENCNSCGKCAEQCFYSALRVVK